MDKKKKIGCCILILLFCLLLSYTRAQVALKPGVKVLKGPDPNAIYFQLRAGEPKIIHLSRRPGVLKNGEVSVHIEGFSTKLSLGDPILPYQLYHVILPPDADPSSLELEVIRFVETEMLKTYKVAPAPPHVPCQETPQDIELIELQEKELLEKEVDWGVGKKIVDGKNLLIYNNDAFYPAQNCRVNYGGQQRKWKIATIAYYPVRYNPTKGKLLVAKEVDLKISFRRDSTYLQQPEVKKLMRDNVFDDRVRDKVLNFTHAKQWYVKHLLKGEVERDTPNNNDGSTSSQPPDPNYVIITTDETFTNSTALDDFCFHKENLGFEVMVVTENDAHSVEGNPTIGYSFVLMPGIDGYEEVIGLSPDADRPDKIRKWLQDNYIDLGIEYVLLIGNPDPDTEEPDDFIGDLPMKDCQLHIEADVPTDFYFAELTGDWDLDNDGFAGEFYTSSGESFGIPGGITDKELFSVRWEGVLDVDYTVTDTALTADVAAGSYYVYVADSTGFARYHSIRIGAPGAADTEYVGIHSIDGNQLRVATLSHDHPAGTEVETVGYIYLVARTEGNTKIWFGENGESLDDLDDSDVILPINPEHPPYKELSHIMYLPNGQYPIRIEYTQSSGDAYFFIAYDYETSYVNVAFKHDDDTANYVDGLDADFFNNDTLSGAPIAETTLTADVAAGSYYVYVADSTGFARYHSIRIGAPGAADTEYVRIHSIDENELRLATLSHDHPAGTEVETIDSPFVTRPDYAKVLYAVSGDTGIGGVEFFPEVIVGRIPCYDEEDPAGLDYDKLDNILNKIITYENAELVDNPWRRGVLTSCPYVADSDDPPDHIDDVAKYEWSEMLRNDYASPALWNWYRIYEEDYPGLSSPPEVVIGSMDYATAMNETQAGWNDPDDPDDGRGVVMWMSHGGQTSAARVFNNHRCRNLDDSKPSIVFMGACLNGKPEFYPPYGISLGYANLKEGAIATVSATRESYG